MIKAIIFDAGGVYLKGTIRNFINKACNVLGINANDYLSNEIFFDSDYNKGKISVEECLRKYFKVNISELQMQKLKEALSSTWVLDEEVLEIIN